MADSVKPKAAAAEDAAPTSQERRGFRQNWPVWLKHFPRLKFPPPNDDYQLIDLKKMQDFFRSSDIDPEAVKRIEHDIEFLEHELLRLFRERDYEAKYQQNRYRLFQLTYILLATTATLIGSLLALSLNGNANLVPLFGFAETVVALLTTYIANISGREPPMQLWMSHRRRAEHLRREYFRYLMDLEPYDTLNGYEREMLLSRRAAIINRGETPDNNPQKQS